MAKGDDARARNRITEQGGLAQNNLNNLRTRTLEQQTGFQNNYNNAINRQLGDYNQMMGGYSDFAKTGGFTPQGISAMRNRAMAPNRGIMAAGQRGIERQRGLQGGYSPGATAALSRLQRDTGQQMSDTATGVEASLADMVQRGKLAGLAGGTQLYGTTPAQANMFGNQLLANMQQQGNIEGMQGDLARTMIQGQISAGQLPGKWEHNVDRIGDVMNIGSKAAQGINAFLKGRGGPLPSKNLGFDPRVQPGNIGSQGASEGMPLPGQVAGTTAAGIGGATVPGLGAGGNLAQVGEMAPSVITSSSPVSLWGAGMAPGAAIPSAGIGGMHAAVPAGIASQGVTSGGIGAGAAGTQGLTGGTAGMTGGAGGGGAMSGLGGFAAGLALPLGAYAVSQGAGRGGKEGTRVNPKRDQVTKAFQQQYGGNNPYEGMVNALASKGVVGPQAEQLISAMYNAKDEKQWNEAYKNMAWKTGIAMEMPGAEIYTPEYKKRHGLE